MPTRRAGDVWTFSTPTVRSFRHGSRAKDMVGAVLSECFAGALCSDCYAANQHDAGRKQRCRARFLRDIHELQRLNPQTALANWAAAVHAMYLVAKAETRRDVAMQWAYEARLWVVCAAHAQDPAAVQRRLCLHVERHLSELFVFVAEPAPADNNAAERSLRHLVTSRKSGGGTRSPRARRRRRRPP